MNTSLFHKHFPAPFAGQELAQVQAHSRVGLGQLASNSHPNPYVFCGSAVSPWESSLRLNEMWEGR